MTDATGDLGTTRIGPATFRWGERTYVMGILNVTPDSFSGDGLLAGPGAEDPVEAAVAQARRMVADGADILDVGGESTRPGHVAVSADEERARVVPVIAAIRAALPDTPLSVDTTKAAIAEVALAAGADLINDVWGVGDDDTPPSRGNGSPLAGHIFVLSGRSDSGQSRSLYRLPRMSVGLICRHCQERRQHGNNHRFDTMQVSACDHFPPPLAGRSWRPAATSMTDGSQKPQNQVSR